MPHRNCDDTCNRVGLTCSEDELLRHNSDVDSSKKLIRLIERLRGTVSVDSCFGGYGSTSAVPVFTNGFCSHSEPFRQASTFNCSARPAHNYQRLCFCSTPLGNEKLYNVDYA